MFHFPPVFESLKLNSQSDRSHPLTTCWIGVWAVELYLKNIHLQVSSPGRPLACCVNLIFCCFFFVFSARDELNGSLMHSLSLEHTDNASFKRDTWNLPYSWLSLFGVPRLMSHWDTKIWDDHRIHRCRSCWTPLILHLIDQIFFTPKINTWRWNALVTHCHHTAAVWETVLNNIKSPSESCAHAWPENVN